MSSKEELHRLIDELPESELVALQHLLHTPRLPDFIELSTLIAQQRFTPLHDPLSRAAGIWPEDEPVDDFLAAREVWQHEGKDA